MKTTIKLEGFEGLAKRLDPKRFKRRLRYHVKKATLKNALLAEGAIKRGINSGKDLAPNSPFTVLMKGSSRPLVDSSELTKSIAHELLRYSTALFGVLRNKSVTNAAGKQKDLFNIAYILHEGATIDVTERMRRLFFALARANPGKVLPLRKTTIQIVIPARRFLLFALSKQLKAKYKANWELAVNKALQRV